VITLYNGESKRNIDNNVTFHKNNLKKLVLFRKQYFSYKINKKECIAEYMYKCIHMYTYCITLCIQGIWKIMINLSQRLNGLNWEKKVLYYFAIFAIIKILIAKNCRKLIFNNLLLEYYQLYKKIARDNNC